MTTTPSVQAIVILRRSSTYRRAQGFQRELHRMGETGQRLMVVVQRVLESLRDRWMYDRYLLVDEQLMILD